MLSNAMKQRLVSILRDDLGRGDITSALLKPEGAKARIVAGEACTIAGLEEACFLFKSRRVKAKAAVKDGKAVKKGKIVLRLSGINRNILMVERTALNVLGRMSAVATACSKAKRLVPGTTIALTRKTMPGFNLFDKKAAVIAGAWPHRINLNSFVLLKDNHLPFFDSPQAAVKAAKKRYKGGKKIEVEVDSLKQALDAAKEKPNIIMLDNFSPSNARKAVKELRKAGFKGKIELSGGITLKNLKNYKGAGANIISMGALTQAVSSKNFLLEIL